MTTIGGVQQVHVKEIQFLKWLSSVVLVPKPGNEPVGGFHRRSKLLNLMDASRSYHQIMLNPDDQKQVSFIRSGGAYCYIFMPFGLKNAGDTYQRLVDRIFQEQQGCNMEVYVDDMLVKSQQMDQQITYPGETFTALRKYRMKLNPAKRAFGVRNGRFLGHIVTKKGIEVNPDKILSYPRDKSPS
ncbi:UNVERIFIED_CONTAM: Retrovirus-related Pol polyprotein from transposon gypsy [Sesamum radiatum]|uniref:Retrovirus-related Pol polyprotein from transposon gypsy n=1 Tax=Sesamum radiatum TaxID=300843 RepID=A0AAW2S1U7_SESRA